MAEIHITPAAENDLITIWLYIARDNPEAADRVYQAVEDTFESLASLPHIGPSYQSKRAQLKGVRFFSVSKFQSYVIYYREYPKGIEIIRVLHAHMNKQRRLKPK
ncbi:type II toxin-antitoxin system RelE/ParE family toxin [Desulfoprunum benzoelyticum]|uniref:Toxin ParE1/3/4 n=1 Tax=Desulfoprunum benzoelyticum TaxID=1506996 RepID=A0A840UX72_9BACT|nr:type II toxin-antitoxin system RelE/ParE family toxin [Desulfoprunum benzoelyticum]MBB5348044.1 toxin ParE1/3/4 [Desulfoprunum benzoelyticum]MBM9531416.1 type II toxin-antitoxin system RelE/ParE family toxin [Desulfoprunum benzoelyticum]